MTDHGVLMSVPMVLGLFEGRKTETRRIITPQPEAFHSGRVVDLVAGKWRFRKSRWKAGDRLWVREFHWSWGIWLPNGERKNGQPRYRFEHEGQRVTFDNPAPNGPMAYFGGDLGWAYHPGIHMPRWASRLTLLVKEIRIERLHGITEEAAIAEGVVRISDFDFRVPLVEHPDFPYLSRPTAREMYAALWDVINGSGMWLTDPWVTVTRFEVTKRNIDKVIESVRADDA